MPQPERPVPGLEGTRTRAVLAVLALAAGAAALASGLLLRLPSPCPLRHLAGIPCATCGLTRALGAALHGDFGGAAALHPAAPVVLLGAAALLALLLAEAATGRPAVAPAWCRVRGLAAWTSAAVFAEVWILRGICGAPLPPGG